MVVQYVFISGEISTYLIRSHVEEAKRQRLIDECQVFNFVSDAIVAHVHEVEFLPVLFDLPLDRVNEPADKVPQDHDLDEQSDSGNGRVYASTQMRLIIKQDHDGDAVLFVFQCPHNFHCFLFKLERPDEHKDNRSNF